jgi:peptide/nickel transport system ATP-binding protein
VIELFERPMHPYTRGLMSSIPRRRRTGAPPPRRLSEIPGIVPSLKEPIVGCAFAPRCGFATERCRAEAPALRPVGSGHLVSCWNAEQALAAA